MLSALLLFFVFILWLVYAHYFRPYYIIKRATGLPGPSPKVYLGNCSEIARLGYLKVTEKWMAQYGPTFICYFGIKPVIVTEDLQIIKSVLAKNFDNFINRSYTPGYMKGNIRGLMHLRDDDWRRIHRILRPTFSSKKVRSMSPLIQDCCERLKNKMATVIDTDTIVDVHEWFGIVTMEIILATAFSRDISFNTGKETPLIKAATCAFRSLSGRTSGSAYLEWVMMILSHFPWSVPFLRFFARRTEIARSWDYLTDTAFKLIEERRNSMNTPRSTAQDLLQLMMEAHDDDKGTNSETGTYLSNDEIVGEVAIFILAGYETTSNSLSYTAYLLALNPTIQDRLIKEINDYYDANPDCSLYDAAENIEYVTMVFNESMRMYPPIPRTARECRQTCAVKDGFIIEKGFDTFIPIFLLHRNPNYWPDPDKFDPERFNPNKEQSYPTYAYLPFGEGPRQCIGRGLALVEAKMTLVAILKDFYFKKTADTEVPVELSVGITMCPKNGVKLSIGSNSL